MILANAKLVEGRTLLVLGLTRNNINKLLTGKPMHLRHLTHPALRPDQDIMIFFGETELAMKTKLEKEGLIGPKTEVIVDPRLQE